MKPIRIGTEFVGGNNPCFISFEPGATYSNFDEAKKMLSAVIESGANAVKFQTFFTGEAERIMGKKDIKVKFSDAEGEKEELVLEALRRRELSKNEWKKLIEFSKSRGLNFITAPYFLETVDFLHENKIDAIKVSKGDVNNTLLIDKIAKTKIPIIIDAREKLEDIKKAIKICLENDNDQIVIMHCPSGYPSTDAGVHLKAISFLQEKFDYPIAFSDHSPGDMMNYAAIALGASMIEKTITTDKTISNIEHYMSLELLELKEFMKNIRKLENAIGDPKILYMSRVEENARRSLVSKSEIKQGETISIEKIDFKRPGNMGISCSEGFKILGKKAIRNIAKDEFFQWDQLE